MPLALALVAIEATYVFIISAGTFTTWSTWNTNYDLMAEGFRAGHLYIPVAPPPELLAKVNPFAWSNINLWFLDASLYNGHYYLYWGPVPALGLLAVKVALRIKSTIGDQYVLFVAYTIFLIAGALFIERMTRRLFPEVPRWLVVVATAAFAYTMPTPYMLATPGIYEAAIGAAQAFLLLGLLFAFDAVWAASEAPAARWRLVLAGACWAAAIGCRVSAVLPAGAFVLLTAAFSTSARGRIRWRRMVVSALWAGTPIVLTLAALATYNKLRFDSWTEVGVTYQLNTFPFVTSRRYLPLNIFSYLLRPVGTHCRFPFVSALYDIGAHGFPRGVRFPPGYSTHEPQAGLLVTSPWTWLAGVAAFFVVRNAAAWRRAPAGPVVADQTRRTQVWLVASLVGLAFLMPLVFIAAFDATMRYLGDLSTGMSLLGVWGAWSLFGAARGRWRRRGVVAVLVVLATLTVILGGLLGFQGYDEMFKNHNPGLYAGLHQRLSLCR